MIQLELNSIEATMIFFCFLALPFFVQSIWGQGDYGYQAEKQSFVNKVASFFVTQLRPIKILDFDVQGYGKCSNGGRHAYGIAKVIMTVSCPYHEVDLCGLHGTQDGKTETLTVVCQYAGEINDEDGNNPLAGACYQEWNTSTEEIPQETLCRKWRYRGTDVPQLKLPEHVKSPYSHILFYKTAKLESFSGYSSKSMEVDTYRQIKNKHERTGFSGMGKLKTFGPNFALYLLITRVSRGVIKVLIEDTENYIALPQFWLKEGTTDYDIITRKLLKLNQYCKESEIRLMAKNGQKYHTGYLKNKHNTDNAWLEGEIIHVHDPMGVCFSNFPVHATATTRRYKWHALPRYITINDFAESFVANYK